MAELMRFRLLNGQHVQNDPVTGKSRHYPQGSYVDSPIDLAAKFGADKFQRLHEPQPTPQQQAKAESDGLDELEEEELKQLARSRKVEIGRCKGKADLLAAIRKSK